MNTTDMKNFLLSLQAQVTGLQLQVNALTMMLPETLPEATPPQTPIVLETPSAPSRIRGNEIVSSTEAVAPLLLSTPSATLPSPPPPQSNDLLKMSGKELIAERCRITGRTVVPEHWSETKAQIIADIKRLQTDAAYLAKVKARVTKRSAPVVAAPAAAPVVAAPVAAPALAATEPKAKKVMSPEHKAKFLAAGAAARAAKKAAKEAAAAVV